MYREIAFCVYHAPIIISGRPIIQPHKSPTVDQTYMPWELTFTSASLVTYNYGSDFDIIFLF